jgi:CDGSH-type Zn-finger protein
MSGTPTVAGRAPIKVDVEAGKAYYWCACGMSKAQPFCDGSHKGSGFAPMKYDAAEAAAVYFCACKQTHNAPLCDGSHKNA